MWVVFDRDSGVEIAREYPYADAKIAQQNYNRINREFGIEAELRYEDED